MTQRPERWFQRRYGADGNVIENNTFIDEDNGVWVASRMGENTLPMECSDPQYLPGYALDYADDNVVRDNHFQNVTFGVRVEDDDADRDRQRLRQRRRRSHEAIVVGTRYRTEALVAAGRRHDHHRQQRQHHGQPESVSLDAGAHQHDVQRQPEPRSGRRPVRGPAAARAGRSS